jgi:hypothetical protein
MYTQQWHNFKRLAQKICTFFAASASRSSSDAYVPWPTPAGVCHAGAGSWTTTKTAEWPLRTAGGRVMFLDPLHFAAAVMFLVIWAIVGDITITGRRLR